MSVQPAAIPSFPCWCGATNWGVCFRTAAFGLVGCRQCSCYRIDPRAVNSQDEAQEFYSKYYARAEFETPKTQAPERASRFWRIVNMHPELKNSGTSVLDVGSGDGGLCAELREAGWMAVMGLEISSARLQRARARYPGIRFVEGPLEQAGLSDASLDLVVMDNVIEHLPAPLEFVAALRRPLRPGGTLVVITPNMRSGHFRLLGRRWTPELAPHVHDFLFTPEALEYLVRTAGFELQHRGSFHLPFYSPIALASRLLRDPRGAVWRAAMECGGLAGRLLGQGEMLYVVAKQTGTAS